jgi:hypothetical protein
MHLGKKLLLINRRLEQRARGLQRNFKGSVPPGAVGCLPRY